LKVIDLLLVPRSGKEDVAADLLRKELQRPTQRQTAKGSS